ncbi:MAG: hypothetical protein K6E50_09250 [Lachnospiraceae bacterium]|nr:hypothetical protein [Lachnospiraceae bacterium]
MKYISVILVLIALILTACTREEDPPENVRGDDVRGGTTKTQDENAPKTIESHDLVSLDCMVSTVSMVYDDDTLDCGKFYFSCSLDESSGTVTGSYRFEEHYDRYPQVEFPFTADKAFLTELDQIIVDSGIARWNGRVSVTNGIPDDFGYSFRAVYASGEKIYCRNNQSTEIPLATIHDLNALFYEKSGAKAYYDTDEPLSMYFTFYGGDDYTFTASACKKPDGTYVLEATENDGSGKKKFGEKETDKAFMDKVSAAYEAAVAGGSQGTSSGNAKGSIELNLKFGKKEQSLRSDERSGAGYRETLEGIRDLILEEYN